MVRPLCFWFSFALFLFFILVVFYIFFCFCFFWFLLIYGLSSFVLFLYYIFFDFDNWFLPLFLFGQNGASKAVDFYWQNSIAYDSKSNYDCLSCISPYLTKSYFQKLVAYTVIFRHTPKGLFTCYVWYFHFLRFMPKWSFWRKSKHRIYPKNL